MFVPLEKYRAILAGKKRTKLQENRDELDTKISEAQKHLEHCNLCEWRCGVNRHQSLGRCGVSDKPSIASVFLHFGEESILVPSLTVFFHGCNFKCVFCQNWDISQNSGNQYVPPDVLARILNSHKKAKNINWVGGEPTPSIPYMLQVMKHIHGNIPQIWNSNMYLTPEAMGLILPFIDVYLTDFKYGNDECAYKYSKIRNYFSVVSRNHKMAYDHGEIIVRHLILPGHLECCTYQVIDWVADNIPDAALNLMAQYRPEYKAYDYPELRRRITKDEYMAAYRYAKRRGLYLIDEQIWLEYINSL